MSDDSSELDAVEQLGEEFLARHRRGERPTITEYASARPELAERIRRIFPVMMFAEQMGGVVKEPSPEVPERLGEYRIVREIGRGGMGVVYEAVQESLGRHVALKVLPKAGSTDAQFQTRFQREARAAARMHHPNIVPVFGVGEDRGIHFYAMQFIHGRGLDSVLRDVQRQHGQAKTRAGAKTPNDRTLVNDEIESRVHASTSDVASHSSPADAGYNRGVARMALQVAQALEYAHGQGIQHRDIKPSNLLIDAVGTVWVTDFGLARSDDDGGLTHTGEFVGTLRYMAPERFSGESTISADIYALGVTLYELLTLRPAFGETDRARLMQQVLNEEPPPPRQLDKKIPRDLETIVLKAMAKEPRDRYPSAGALAEDLRLFVADEPIRARRPPIVERVRRWCRRNPRQAGITAIAAMLLAVILIGLPVSLVRIRAEKEVAIEQLYDAHVSRAGAQRMTGDAGRRFQGLESLDLAHQLRPHLRFDPARLLHWRDQFLACMSLADLGPRPGSLRYPPGSAALCFDADLTRYALGDEQGEIVVRRADTDKELLRLPGVGIGAWALKFSPDGRYLAAGYHRKYRTNSEEFRVWDCQRREAVLTVKSETGCGEADFSADSRFVAFGRDKAMLVIHDLSLGTAQSVQLNSLPNAIAFHPSGEQLAVALKKIIEIRDAKTDKVLKRLPPLLDEVWALAWQPGGRILAAATGPAIAILQDDEPQPIMLPREHEDTVYALAFSRGGALLASKAHDSTVRLWDVSRRQPLVRAYSAYTGCSPIHFEPNDRHLGYGSDGERVWLWDVALGDECRVLTLDRPPPKWLSFTGSFHPDSRMLLVGGLDGVRLWDCGTGREFGLLPAQTTWGVAATETGIVHSSRAGLHRWPIATDPTGNVTIGPSSMLVAEGTFQHAAASRDGRVVAARRTRTGVHVLRDGQPAVIISRDEHPQMFHIAVSPDGRWVATGSQTGSNVCLWDAATGHRVREAKIPGSASVAFSPDSRQLFIGTDNANAMWDIETWQPKFTVPKQPESGPRGASLTQDGRLLAVRHGPAQLHLLDPSDGRRLAEFSTPARQAIIWHALSPDGHFLAAGGYGNAIYLWDLHALRRPLAERGTDWSSQPVPPLAAVPPRSVRIVTEPGARPE